MLREYHPETGKWSCDSGAEWSVFNSPADWNRREVAQLYGCNDMTTGRPRLLKLAGGLLIYPVYVVQVPPLLLYCWCHQLCNSGHHAFRAVIWLPLNKCPGFFAGLLLVALTLFVMQSVCMHWVFRSLAHSYAHHTSIGEHGHTYWLSL